MIRMADQDIDFMLRALALPDELGERLRLVRAGRGELSADDADRLRDLCGERLQTHGFGPDYTPTEEGRRLERLIDELYLDRRRAGERVP
jgi:hypothetical protein